MNEENIKRFVSVSGGKSSAYVAANYESDHLVFALVTSSDPLVKFPDAKLRQLVSDRIGREFIGTLEDDIIIHTIFDLEQFLGRQISWVAGKTFDQILSEKNHFLPNLMMRYCTSEMKIDPIFSWWEKTINDPAEVLIGFRAGEERRATRMFEKCNEEGFLEFRKIIGKRKDGRNIWGQIPWQKPVFPMIEDGVRRDHVHEFWRGRSVRFAERNNCVGCFHRNPLLLRLMFDKFPEKMEWFAQQEETERRSQWMKQMSYRQIQKHRTQLTMIDLDGFSECDSGYCGL